MAKAQVGGCTARVLFPSRPSQPIALATGNDGRRNDHFCEDDLDSRGHHAGSGNRPRGASGPNRGDPEPCKHLIRQARFARDGKAGSAQAARPVLHHPPGDRQTRPGAIQGKPTSRKPIKHCAKGPGFPSPGSDHPQSARCAPAPAPAPAGDQTRAAGQRNPAASATEADSDSGAVSGPTAAHGGRAASGCRASAGCRAISGSRAVAGSCAVAGSRTGSGTRWRHTAPTAVPTACPQTRCDHDRHFHPPPVA